MFKIEVIGAEKIAYINTPFQAEFNVFLKNKCAGKWDKLRSAWCVAPEFVGDIREKMKEIFGHDDTFCEKLVSLKITFHKKIVGQEITIFSRTILFQKLNEIKKGYGVVIPANTYRQAKGEIEIDAGTTVILRDFPLPKLAEVQILDENVEVKIIHDEYDVEMLKSEKKQLCERLCEIEKMLQKMEDEK